MLVTALAVALSAFLNYGKFLRTFTELEASRFAFIASDIKGVIEGGLDLGVSLRGMVTAQAVIDDQAERDPQIYGIVVFNDAGKVLYRTGPVAYETTVPPEWVADLDGREASWSAVDSSVAVAGVRLSNDIRQVVGGVAVLYSRQIREQMLRSMAEKLALGAAISAVVTALLAYLGVSILVRRVRRDVDRAEISLHDDAQDAAAPFAKAHHATETALREIAVVANELERVSAEPTR